ncbi:MAG TPA: hypothetical protein VF144_05330, partial [Chitinophagaceae bacterium]
MNQTTKPGIVLLIILMFPFAFSAFSQESDQRIVEDGGTGRYKAIMMKEASLPAHTIFRPADLNSFKEKSKLPIITWGNGACFDSPWEHINFLNEVASHGFLVIAIGFIPAVSGEKIRTRSTSAKLLEAIDWTITQNKDKNSPYYNKIDTTSIAVSGMSCGGLQALEVAGDPRIKTIVICNSGILPNPGSGMPGMPQISKDQLKKIHTPALYLLGGPSDIAYNNGMDDFRQINHVPVSVGNLDVGHAGTYSKPHGGEFARVATAWYKWQLKGDTEAEKM